MIIIGICGQMGVGKDTVSDYIVTKYGYHKLIFIKPAKDFVAKIFGFSHDQLYGESAKRNMIDMRCLKKGSWEHWLNNLHIHIDDFCEEIFPQGVSLARNTLYSWFDKLSLEHNRSLTPRIVLQTLGTEWGQSLSKTIWADYTLHQAASLGKPKYVISDVRFAHEINAVLNAHGKLIKLERNIDNTATHLSETEILGIPEGMFDATISNNSDKAHLYATLDIIVPALERTRVCHTSGFPPSIS